ncbi:Proteophosphoglycan ppg4 [Rhodotorula toruloides]|nr:Proteophosphoglycan ppg4 [Rhodotorula toruloides]
MLPRSTSPTTSTGPAAEASFLSSQRWTTGHEGAGSLGTEAVVAAAVPDAGEGLPAAKAAPMRSYAGSGAEETLETAAWTREEDSALSVAVGRSAVGDWEGVRQAFMGVTGSQRSALALSERWEVLRLGQLTSRKFSRRPRPRSPIPSCSSDSFDRSSPDPLDFSREETTLRWLRVHHSATPPDQHGSPSSTGILPPLKDSQSHSAAKRGRNEEPDEMVSDPFVGGPPRRQGSPTDDAAIPPWLSSPSDEQRAYESRSDAIRAAPSSDATSYTSLSAGLDPEPDPPERFRNPARDADVVGAQGLTNRDSQRIASILSTVSALTQKTSVPTPDALPLPRQPFDAPATTDPIELVVQGCALPSQTSPPRLAPAAFSFSTSAPLEPLELADLREATSAPPRPSTSRRFSSVYHPSPNRSSTLQIETTHVRDHNDPPPPFKPRLLTKGIAKAARRRESTALRPSLPSRQVTSENAQAADPSTSTDDTAQLRQSFASVGSPTTSPQNPPTPEDLARPSSMSVQQPPSPPPSLPDTTMRDSLTDSAGQDSACGGSGDVGREKETAKAAEDLEDWQASLDAADRLSRRLLEIAASLRV